MGLKAQVENKYLSDTERKIMSLRSENALSKKEVIEKLGHKALSGNIKRAFSRLMEMEFLSYTIPERPNSRKQKYYVTEKEKESIK